jgi:S-DNA-T family DNA segregation ATPase FtsK/SpoIIIE
MERRYTVIKNARVRDRNEYYKFRDSIPDFEYMPQIIIIIDELADLMLQVREHVEEPINRLAAKARACGINLVIGTQRPSTDIVTGLIKANIPSKIAFRVASNVDSRVILGNVGAEKLLGRGDMLYHPTGGNQIRAQGAFVDTPEIKRVLDFIIDRNGKVEYDPEILYRLQSETDKLTKNDKKAAPGGDEDYAIDSADVDFDYLCQAIELVINLGKATTNVIQRHLKIGFNRASNIVDKLEDLGFISKSNGSSRPRDVLIDLQTYYDWKNSNKK